MKGHINKRGRIEIQPRLKIQYPMKNHFIPDKRHTNNNLHLILVELRVFLPIYGE